MKRKNKKALILGGGAPNATLMAGALLAFEQQGVSFDVISCSGAGTTIGLLYTVPKHGTPSEALRNTVELGVSDPIYQAFPVNYKVFNKPGPQAEWFRQLLSSNPMMQMLQSQRSGNRLAGFVDDWMKLMLAMACPTDLNPNSQGLCAHVPFVDHLVDFDRLPGIRPDFYVNAYNITDREMAIWSKHDITLKHYQAALSYPFLYAPCEIDGKKYYEGAVVDCLNYKGLLEAEGGKHADIDTIVVFDVLSSDKLIREPRNLWDAYTLSIIAPLVDVARNDTELFELKYNRDADGKPLRNLLKVPFDIPDYHLPEVLDWSSYNLEKLFRIGFNAGLMFSEQHAEQLDIMFNPTIKPMRIGRRVKLSEQAEAAVVA
ncbi:patatin-like phospholipase family protein [Chitinivorax sp. B]|uniref:patatin-like phospholipase family protein n=1 Tax=Chitinivorax sp. B TaxID=2502235 RepID=UPI001BB2470F|nr:patatin-like phospholipase family protein [Chitinivorax sp. B]